MAVRVRSLNKGNPQDRRHVLQAHLCGDNYHNVGKVELPAVLTGIGSVLVGGSLVWPRPAVIIVVNNYSRWPRGANFPFSQLRRDVINFSDTKEKLMMRLRCRCGLKLSVIFIM